jgi:hypothetical protein
MGKGSPVLVSALLALATSLGAAPAGPQTPIAELVATDASIRGAVTMTASGTQLLAGSSVTAGQSTASLRLARGGEVRVCPHSALSVSASPSGNELMLAMSAGAMETHYRVGGSADTILTPDFRIVLAGPGEFHFAIAADARGDTCVRALPANTSSLIVYEQMGDGVYQVHPHDQLLFHRGSVANPDLFAPPDCGCPAASRNLLAETQPPAPKPEKPRLQPALPALPAVPGELDAGDKSLIEPPPAANEVHVQVEAPFVFRATEPQVPEPPIVARVRLQSLPTPALPGASPPAVAVAEQPRQAKPPRRGLFGHLRSFFVAVFR